MKFITPEQLVTKRLLLRRPVVADIEPYIAFFASERSAMAMGPLSRSDAFKEFCFEIGLWEVRGFGNYSVLLNGTPIGLAGIWQPEDFDEPEIGWLLWDGFEGHGYATEAAMAIRDMVEGLGWAAPASYIDVNNTASKAVAQRLGARFESLHSRWPDTEIWRHRSRAIPPD